MKTHYTATNDAAEATYQSEGLLVSFNAFEWAEGAHEGWVRVAEWGEYPAVICGPRGQRFRGAQLVDPEGAAEMVRGFNSLLTKVAHLGRGLPIWEGHPDDPAWKRENPEAGPRAVGRIKELEVRSDGPWMRVALNSIGMELLGGDAPAYSAHSPKFGMAETPVRPGIYRVVALHNTGLTNFPNIPGNAIGINEESPGSPHEAAPAEPKPTTRTMKPKLLQLLGLMPEASDEAIATAVNSIITERDAALAAKTALDGQLTAANERATTLEGTLGALRIQAAEPLLASAINDGRITEADRPKWLEALNTDWEGESAKLGKLMPLTALNTQDRVGDLGARKAEAATGGGITAINAAMAAHAKEHRLDLRKGGDYDTIYLAVKAAKPELFETAR